MNAILLIIILITISLIALSALLFSTAQHGFDDDMDGAIGEWVPRHTMYGTAWFFMHEDGSFSVQYADHREFIVSTQMRALTPDEFDVEFGRLVSESKLRGAT